MALNTTKTQDNCSDARTPSALTVADSIANNITEVTTNLNDVLAVDNESQRIIRESHENSFQTALLYISIILSVYLLTIMFIGIRYALNRYYDKTFDLCCPIQCCEYCTPSHMSCSCCDSSSRKRNVSLISLLDLKSNHFCFKLGSFVYIFAFIIIIVILFVEFINYLILDKHYFYVSFYSLKVYIIYFHFNKYLKRFVN